MIKETIPFNFDDIYSGVQSKFTENGYDIQEGSNTAQLITAMSYLISMLNTNTAVNINENLLTLARKRNNILQDARLLGYEPVNKVSYQYELELTLPGGNFILPKYAEFISGDKKYYYMGDLISIPNAPANYKLNIVVKEGILIRSTEDNNLSIIIKNFIENGVSKPQYYVDIPYTDIEDDGIEAYLTYYDDNGVLFNKQLWKKIETFTVDADTILNKQFYRINKIDYNTPRIYFKLPNTSNDIRLGTKIDMNILKSSGSKGVITDNLSTELNCEITNIKIRIKGTDEESSESIKRNAPLFWNSANRAVTKNDYKSICERLSLIDKSHIWDGNDEFPKIPGKIWFSFIPGTLKREFLKDAFRTVFLLDLLEDEDNWFLEESSIQEVFTHLEAYKIPTIELLHRHPVFLDFEFNIEVLKYDITESESSQNEAIFDVINDYFYTNKQYKLENFGVEFFKSNIIKKIDTQITDITGVNISLKNSITLYNKYIVNENDSKIIIPLGLPYEDYYTNTGDLIVDNMPSIDTENFIDDKHLKVDWSALTGSESSTKLIELDILLDTDIIGVYKIFNKNRILVEFFIDGVILTPENINQKKIDVKYRTDNIQITKNTIPRLKKVNFI